MGQSRYDLAVQRHSIHCLTNPDRRMGSILSSSSSAARTSHTLLERVARRDADAWQRFAKLYGPLVFHWCRRQGLSEHDAADTTQDVFASVARAISRFEVRPGASFRGWLWTVTRNQLRDFFRLRAQQTRAEGGSSAWERLAAVAESLSDDPDEHTAAEELHFLHRRGLELVRGEFEERTWQLFWRSVVLEQSTADIARDFGLSNAAVRQARSRVLRRLRQELGDTSAR